MCLSCDRTSGADAHGTQSHVQRSTLLVQVHITTRDYAGSAARLRLEQDGQLMTLTTAHAPPGFIHGNGPLIHRYCLRLLQYYTHIEHLWVASSKKLTTAHAPPGFIHGMGP